jgi:hypothetical protein
MAVECVNCRLSLRRIRHRDKTEALAAICHTVFNDTNGGNFAEFRERLFESIVSRRVREVTNIDVHLLLSLLVINGNRTQTPA